MNGWAVCALIVIGAPLALLVRWAMAEWLRERRRQRFIAEQLPDWSVAGIQARLEQERADAAVSWPATNPEATQPLPVAEPGDEPTAVISRLRPLVRRRQYVDRPPRPWPRAVPLSPPDTELLRRVRDGLEKL